MNKFLILLFSLSIFLANAQNAADLDLGFGGFSGLNDNVFTTVTQSDGKILLGGNFTTYLNQYENRLIRLNTNATKDDSFNIGTGFNSSVNALVIQPDGKILIGGSFSSYQGQVQNYLIRLNTDGSKDTSFNLGTGFNNYVKTINLQSDGKIIVGDAFTSYQGQSQSYIVRLNSDGTKDNNFNVIGGFNGSVEVIKIQNDGKILVGGYFVSFLGQTEKKLIRLNTDGIKDTTFITGSGFDDGTVSSMLIQSDGKILVGGYFTGYNGVPEKNFIRLNSDGTKDTSFNLGIGFGQYDNIFSIAIQNDGKIIVGGRISSFQGNFQSKLIRLNADGSKDISFDIGLGFSGTNDATVFSLTLQNDGKVFVGGAFSGFNGNLESYFIKLNSNGTKDNSFIIPSVTGIGFNDAVTTTVSQTDGKILIGGIFTKYQGQNKNRISRLNSDSTIDNSFNIGIGFNNSVLCMALQTDGKILVGGTFTTYQNQTQVALIRLNSDGSKDSTFNLATGFTGPTGIYSILIQNDGKIIVGGVISSFLGIGQTNIIRLNSDGSKDNSYNLGSPINGFNATVTNLAIQNDGKILVGGYFTSFQNQTQNKLVRLNLDGSKDNTFDVGTGFNNNIECITVQSDGKILVGGTFTSYKGLLQNRFIRLNTDGSKDSSFINIGFSISVNALHVLNSGKILVGGNFDFYNGFPQKKLISLNSDGTLDTSFNLNGGFKDKINCITSQNNKILVGGYFTNYQSLLNTAFLVRLKGDSALSSTTFSPENNINIWPNPVKDYIFINNSNEFNSIEVYDLQGKQLLNQKSSFDRIDVSNLQKGIYLLKLNLDSKQFSKKFFKE